jgi:hypothetical protein
MFLFSPIDSISFYIIFLNILVIFIWARHGCRLHADNECTAYNFMQTMSEMRAQCGLWAITRTRGPRRALRISGSPFSSTDVNWRVSCTIKPEEPPTLQYQKASCLYDAIKETASFTPSCTFVGCHSIIRCDNIDHARREQIVASDLRKIVKIPFRSVFF